MDLDAFWYTDGEWQGYVFADDRTRLLEQHMFVTYLTGFRHYVVATDPSACRPGAPLALVPEPDNEFDSAAVAVWDAARSAKLGNLPRVVVVDLPAIDDVRHGVVMAQLTRQEGIENIWIAVSREPLTLRVIEASGRQRAVRSAVAKMKRRFRQADALRERLAEGGDPLEQMRRMMEASPPDEP